MKKLIFTFLCISICFELFASTFTTFNDTPRVHKLNREQFLELHASDDTSRALINYYFDTRKTDTKKLLIYGGASVTSGIIFDRAIMNDSVNSRDDVDNEGGPLGFIGGFFFAFCAWAFGFATLVTGISRITKTRKRLLKDLQIYHNGGGIRSKIKKHKLFRKQFLPVQ